jgi:hypothetical protein
MAFRKMPSIGVECRAIRVKIRGSESPGTVHPDVEVATLLFKVDMSFGVVLRDAEVLLQRLFIEPFLGHALLLSRRTGDTVRG